MASGNAQPPALLERVWGEIRELGLESYVADLDMHGFTVIPPEIAAPDGLADRLLEAVLDVAEARRGVRPDVETGSTHAGFKGRYADRYGDDDGDSPIGDYLQALLFEGRAFEEALMNPVLLSMATYLCGYSVVLSSMGCFMKGPNKSSFGFHADTLVPPPWPRQALVCNATYLLTDFSLENGATAFVPGSHRWGRAPAGPETIVGGEDGNPMAVAAEGPAGSLVVWHGATWHGAFNRTAPGLRASLAVLLARPFMRTEEELFGKIPQEMLERHPARFGVLTQQAVTYGWSSEEGSQARVERALEFAAAYAEEIGQPLNPNTDLYA